MRGAKTNLMAALITLAFMSAVRPDPNPSLFGVTLVAILMYESLRWCIWYINRIHKKKIIEQNNRFRKEDGKRLDEFRIDWPIREVS